MMAQRLISRDVLVVSLSRLRLRCGHLPAA